MVPVMLSFVFVFGLVIGSFLNVVISRVPQGVTLMGRSGCPRCDSPIRARDNIPLLGWALLRGKCRDCGLPISVQYPIVEAATGALFVAVTARFAPDALSAPQLSGWVLLVTLLYFAAVSVTLTVIDLQTLRLPNVIVYPSIVVVGLGLTASVLLSPTTDGWTGILIGSAFTSGAFGLVWLLSGGRAIGLGDVKLAVALGALMGYFGVGVALVGFMAAWVFGATAAVVGMLTGLVTRGKPVPFGPALIVATWFALFAGQPVWGWYQTILGF